MTRLLPFTLVALLALTLLPGLARVEAVDLREARDMLAAYESTDHREWLTPIHAHEPFFEKPLPGYAPEIAARFVARSWPGRAEVSPSGVAVSRVVRALLAAALALAVAAAGTRVFGARTGWLAACALASMVGLPVAARADGAQVLASLLAWLGIGAWLGVLTGKVRPAGGSVALGWLAFGAAAMTGGPLPALWPVAGFALYFALARKRGVPGADPAGAQAKQAGASASGWRVLHPLAGALIVVGACLPWYGIEASIHGPGFLARMPWFPYAFGTRESPLTALPLALSFAVVASFPWTPLLAAALADAALRLRRSAAGLTLARAAPPAPAPPLDTEHVEHLLLALALTSAATLALYPGPPLSAALPVLPAVALLVGRFVDRVLEGDGDARAITHSTRWLAMLGTVFAIAGVLLSLRLAEAAAALRLFSAVVFLASWTPLLADLRGARRLAVGLFALPAALGAPVLHERLLPALEPWLNARTVAEAFETFSPPGAPLVLWESPPPSLRQRLKRNFLGWSQLGPRAETALARDGFVYVAWRPALERAATVAITAAGGTAQVLERSPVLVLARFQPAR